MGFSDVTGGLSALDGVVSVNGEGGAVTLTSSGGSVAITTPTANTINLEAASGGSGTVTSVSVTTANGISGTVATATTTPAISLDITGLDASKIADGTVSSAEFQYINSLTSNAQTQLNSKVSGAIGALNTLVASFGCVIGDGTNVITVGQSATVVMPFAMTITGWTIVECSDTATSSSIVVDVWKDTYANYPPTVADTIAGSEKPTLSSATKGQDLALSSWTTSVTAGDIIKFNVDSVTSAKRVAITIIGTRTS